MLIKMTFESIEEMQNFANYLSEKKNSDEKAIMPTEKTEAEEQVALEPITTMVPVKQTPVPDPAPRYDYDKNPAPINTTPIVPEQTVSATPSVPTAEVSYQPDDLARAAMTLMDSGRQGELIQLLAKFGVSALPDLRPEQYGAFATALREMGAKI